MNITSFVWNDRNIEHIADHEVEPEEVEEACHSNPFILRAGKKKDNFYYILGQSEAGRFLFIVAHYIGKGQIKVITARNMNDSERRRYERRGK